MEMVLQNDIDLLNPPPELEKRKHKLKRLVPSPNSYFMDVKCPGCFTITTVFSHSQTVVTCPNCQTVICQPTGGKVRLTEGCSTKPPQLEPCFCCWPSLSSRICFLGIPLQKPFRPLQELTRKTKLLLAAHTPNT